MEKVRWVRDIDSFYDFIGYVVLHAPGRFPVEDYLLPEQQMNLDKAFVELRNGLDIVDPKVADENKKRRLGALLEESLAAYRSELDMKGAHLLQEFEAAIFKK